MIPDNNLRDILRVSVVVSVPTVYCPCDVVLRRHRAGATEGADRSRVDEPVSQWEFDSHLGM